jgi:hypothetical protein
MRAGIIQNQKRLESGLSDSLCCGAMKTALRMRVLGVIGIAIFNEEGGRDWKSHRVCEVLAVCAAPAERSLGTIPRRHCYHAAPNGHRFQRASRQ